MTYLLLTVRFLDDHYHGLLDRDGPPEWPPSPFRLFQALVAGVARRGELVEGEDMASNMSFTDIGKALGWLQQHTRECPPIIIAPKSKTGQAITRFVPNNDGDKKFDRQERLTAKPMIPTLFLLEPGQKPEVHYVWNISDAPNAPVDRIRDAARSLTTLGWGIDMAFADADRADEAKVQTLKGIRWYPKKNAWRNEGMLRTPTYDDEMKECTLSDLRHCQATAMNRIKHGKPLHTVDKPKVFDRVLYTSIERPAARPCCVFRLLDVSGDLFRYPHAKLIHIAGMVRHVAIKKMESFPLPGRDAVWVESFVAGHRPDGCDDHKQFSYIPLPTIGHPEADAMIRNVMIIAPFGYERELEHLCEQLDNAELRPEAQPESCETTSKPNSKLRISLERFTPLPGKFVRESYLGRATVWQTVTPVVLPGHDDHKPTRARQLIEKALRQSEIEHSCNFTWSAVPNFKNCLAAFKHDRAGNEIGYCRPNHLKQFSLCMFASRSSTPSPVPSPSAPAGTAAWAFSPPFPHSE